MVEKFDCQRCGNCCKSFRSDQFKDIKIPSFFDEKGSLIILSKPSLLLWDWEKHLFPKETVTPYHVLFDIKHNRVIIMDYTLKTDCCPLLKENNICTIYDKRPISCMGFPCPYKTEEDLMLPGKVDHSSLCKSELPFEELNKMLGMKLINKDKTTFQVNTKTLKKNLYLRYGKSFIYEFMSSMIAEISAKFLIELTEKNKINLAKKGYDLKFLIKRISSSKKIDISDFFKEHNGPNLKEFISEPALTYIEKQFAELE